MPLIGNTSPYGIFEKQSLTPDSVQDEFILLYRVGSSSSILVVYSGTLQEPNIDYTITEGGRNILFNFVPTTGMSLYVVFLGRELSIPAVAGNYPVRAESTGDGSTTDFVLPIGPLVEAGLIIFIDGVQKRYTEDWTLTGNTVSFLVAPPNLSNIDFYIHGVERSDIISVDNGTITQEKLAPGINIGTGLTAAGDIHCDDLIVHGNLNVLGTTTTINTATLDVDDNEITLNSNFTSGVPSLDGGIRLKRGNEADGLVIFDETNNWWSAGTTGDIQKIIRATEFNNHTSNTSNPHVVTKTQVGLGNVTNDSQLKRSANDFSSFSQKVTPVNGDILLIEDSADSGNKKYITVGDISGGGGGSALTWNEVPGTSQNMAVNNGYIPNNAGLVTLTLPTTCVVGDVIRVSGKGVGGWSIAQSAGQIIHFSDLDTTTGAGGSISSSHRRDAIELVCIVANLEFNVISSIGNMTVV